MEISQMLTQTADDFHKMAEKTKLYDSGSTFATITTTESNNAGGLVSVGTYLWDKQYLLICLVYHFFHYFRIYFMPDICRYILILWDKQYIIGLFSVLFLIFPFILCRRYFSKSKPHPKFLKSKLL